MCYNKFSTVLFSALLAAFAISGSGCDSSGSDDDNPPLSHAYRTVEPVSSDTSLHTFEVKGLEQYGSNVTGRFFWRNITAKTGASNIDFEGEYNPPNLTFSVKSGDVGGGNIVFTFHCTNQGNKRMSCDIETDNGRVSIQDADFEASLTI